MKTALILVQPSMLVCEKKKKEQADYKRYFEGFVSKANDTGTTIIYLGYTHRLWMRVLELSNRIFLFPSDRGCKKLNGDENKRGLSEQEKTYRKKRKEAGELQTLAEGLADSYGTVAESLHSSFSKDRTERIVVCGGMDCRCVYYFIESVYEKQPGLEIKIPSTFLARDLLCSHPLETYLRASKIPFELKDWDAEAVLKLL